MKSFCLITLGILGVYSLNSCQKREFNQDSQTKLVIRGSEPATQSEFGAVLSIQKNGKHHCSATKVSDNLIVTAAHCVSVSVFRRGEFYGSVIVPEFRLPEVKKITLKTVDEKVFDVELMEVLPFPGFTRQMISILTNGPDVAFLRVSGKGEWGKIEKWPIDFEPAASLGKNVKTIIGGFGCQTRAQTDIGKAQFPYVVDRNNTSWYPSDFVKKYSEKIEKFDDYAAQFKNPAVLKMVNEISFFTEGQATGGDSRGSVCPGDSGGGVYQKKGDLMAVVGVNSGFLMQHTNPDESKNLGVLASMHGSWGSQANSLFGTSEWVKWVLGDPIESVGRFSVGYQTGSAYSEGKFSMLTPVNLGSLSVKGIRFKVLKGNLKDEVPVDSVSVSGEAVEKTENGWLIQESKHALVSFEAEERETYFIFAYPNF